MLLILRLVIAIVVVVLSVISIITENYDFSKYTIGLLGIMFIIMGVDEFKKDRSFFAIFCFLVALFSLYVSINNFLTS
ncbi:YczI family protein [Geomicrobium sp. JCM 19038]|uniref:YczI family protein n=1 Tax=Geomicrobium sp. JCM 19038 TaxID=1460635 RepID=UPI0005A6951D|nr:YczI family protein [Geomicrobium sp. JCM 19038]